MTLLKLRNPASCLVLRNCSAADCAAYERGGAALRDVRGRPEAAALLPLCGPAAIYWTAPSRPGPAVGRFFICPSGKVIARVN